MFQTRFKCFKHVANVQNTFVIFKTRLKYLKHVANISTALYSKRVANSRKKNNTRQVSATVVLGVKLIKILGFGGIFTVHAFTLRTLRQF